MRNSNYDKDHHLNCAFQITNRDVIWHTHGPKYSNSNHHLNCAFQITHRDVILRTHGPNYRVSNFNSKCAYIELKLKLYNCCRVKTVIV